MLFVCAVTIELGKLLEHEELYICISNLPL